MRDAGNARWPAGLLAAPGRVARRGWFLRVGRSAAVVAVAVLVASACGLPTGGDAAGPAPSGSGSVSASASEQPDLYVDPAISERSGDVAAELREVFASVYVTIEQHLPGTLSDPVISAREDDDIDGHQMTGWTDPFRGQITVYVGQQVTPADVRDRLPVVLAHELHHQMRITRGPGYGTTALGSFVSEGLAMRFAHDLYPPPDAPRPGEPWCDFDGLWPQAQTILSEETGSEFIARWFDGRRDLPAGAVYCVGHRLVSDYLQRTGTTAADAVMVQAQQVLDQSSYRAEH